jgi:hypothetical protein
MVCISLLGLGNGCYRIRGTSVVSNCFQPENRSLALSIATTGTPLGAATMPILWRFLLYHFTISQIFLILAGILSHLFIAALLMIDTPKKNNKTCNNVNDDESVFSPSLILYMIGFFFLQSGKQVKNH